MIDRVALTTLIPTLVPLGVALIIWMMPTKTSSALGRRRLFVAALLGSGIALALAQIGEDGRALVLISPPPPLSNTHVAFEWGRLSKGLGLAMLGAMGISHLVAADTEISRTHAVLGLALVGGGLGILSSSSLLTHCFTWFFLDLTLLALSVARVPEESIPYAMRRGLLQLVATMLIVAATFLAPNPLGYNTIEQLRGPALTLTMLAVLVRLGVFPLPGSAKQRWESFLIAVCVGGYLWLQIIPVVLASQGNQQGLVVLGWITIGLTGLLAATIPPQDAIPYVILQNIGLIVLASLTDQAVGLATSYVVILQTILSLVILRLDAAIVSFGKWGRLPLLLALASLAGVPFTIGFSTHWHVLTPLLANRSSWKILAASLAFAASASAVWSLAHQSLRRTSASSQQPAWHNQLAFGGASLAALMTLLLGFNSSPWNPDWLHFFNWLSISDSLYRDSIPSSLLLLLTASILPIAGGYIVAAYGGWSRRGRAKSFQWIIHIELNWLYSGMEILSNSTGKLARYLLAILEESLYMGWFLLFSIITLLLVVGK